MGRRQPRNKEPLPTLVIGLGRFGGALAETLASLGSEVLGVDQDARAVQDLADKITHAVEADSTDIEALRQLGAQELSRAVVAIGSDIEASILTTAVLIDLGISEIWAKAVTEPHGRILTRVGAHHVVFPERDVGVRLAHVVAGSMLDYVTLDEGFVLAETTPPEVIVGRPLGETQVRSRYGVTVVCIKPAGRRFTYATPETVPGPVDLLVVAGETTNVQAFSRMS